MENGPRKIGLRVAAGFVMAVIIIVAVFASGIQLPSIEVPGIEVETGKLNILLKDAPVEVDELWIKMTGLEVHKVGEGQWISIDISDAIEEATEEGEDPKDYLLFDLLLYQGDEDVLILAEADVYAGTYNKIRMSIVGAEAWYWVDEEGNELELDETGYPIYPDEITNDPLRVPPERIDVITNFEIGPEVEVTVTIDMQPDWIAISKSGNLRPVLKATIESAGGS